MIYEFKCTNEKCGHIFENAMTLEEYEQSDGGCECPECKTKAKRTWGKVPIKFNFAGTMGKRYLT